MDVRKVAEGLWRWTAPHPDWTPDKGGATGWEREVGCVSYDGPDDFVLIDPQLPPAGTEDRERFWRALDGDVARSGRPLALVITVRWHGRSAGEIAERYRSQRSVRVLAPDPAQDDVRAPLTSTFAPGAAPVAGIESFEAHGADGGEVLLWIPQHGALIAADVLIGAGHGVIRTCPAKWMGEGADGEQRLREQLVPSLRRLLELPIVSVLTSHGEPAWTSGSAALADALASPPLGSA